MAELQPLNQRMATIITQWEAAADRRAIFLGAYVLMTSNMLAAVRSARFADCVWVEQLIHNFANYYFVALERYERNDPELPLVWRRAHDLARSSEVTAMQSLLMGINAHINYDLVLVLVDMLEPEWQSLTPAQRAQRYADHCLVNTIIAETIDEVQDQVLERYARSMALLDLLGGRLDEWLTVRLIRHWRSDVWAQALAIIATADLPERLRMRRDADAAALRRIELLISSGERGARLFGYPLRWLQRLKLL